MRLQKIITYVSIFMALILLGIGASILFSRPLSAAAGNPIVIENQNPGTTAWQLELVVGGEADDINNQIRGYASATSINKGESINFHITVNPAQPYTIDVYRMGYYGGTGGRLMQHIGPLNGKKQPACPYSTQTGLVECKWAVGYTLAVPTTWTTGIYVAKLVNSEQYQSYIIFVVRDDSRVGDFLYQQPVITYQSYNNYPDNTTSGKSLYDFNSYGPNTTLGTKRAVKVSFDRPYGGTAGSDGGGQFTSAEWWERYFVSWAERQGYDISYTTDLDTHLNGARLLKYKGFLSVGHSEYWSKQMYDNVEAARNAGVNLAFFGSNAVYWQIRMEASSTGVPNRIVTCYRDAALDPNPTASLKTINWRDLNRPEQALVGVQYGTNSADIGITGPFIVKNSSHWVWNGTGFADNSVVPKIAGFETDRLYANFAKPISTNYTTLSSSPFEGDVAEASIYQAPSGAWVFGAGNAAWTWGLERAGYTNTGIQQATKNILDRFLQRVGTATPTNTAPAPTATPATTPIPPTATPTSPPPPTTNTPTPLPANPGLNYAYYEGKWTSLPNFDTLTPVRTGTVNNFDLSPTHRADNFGFRYTGCIEMPSNGVYTFYTKSDDGSKLYMDGVQVVNNNDSHSVQERSGTVSLSAGRHAILVTFFDATGVEALEVRYQGPGFAKQLIPNSVLTHGTCNPPQPVNQYRYVRLVAESEVNGKRWAALAELDLLDNAGNLINKALWHTTYTDSEEFANEEGYAPYAIDNDIYTYWHTEHVSIQPAFPHEIRIDLGANYTLSGLRYLPRQDSDDGRIANYKFYVSQDGITWGTPVAQGTFPNTTNIQQVNFTVPTAQVNSLSESLAADTEIPAPDVTPEATPNAPAQDPTMPDGAALNNTFFLPLILLNSN